jgi:Mitochondrial carrier protein.
LTSSIAGIINVLLTNPLWVANLRLVQEPSSLPDCHDMEDNHDDPSVGTSTTPSNQQTITKYRGLIHCLKEICRKEGIRQLWAGTGASLLLVSNPAIQYYIYENCKMTLLEKDIHRLTPRNSLRPLEAFLIGALAKGFATIATYPLQLAQVLMRLQTNNREQEKDEHEHKDNNHGDDKSDKSKEEEMMSHTTKTRYSSLLDCMFKLYKGGGVKALYSGINAKLMQTVLSSALTFLTYEQILNLVAKSYWWVLSKRLVKNRTAT